MDIFRLPRANRAARRMAQAKRRRRGKAKQAPPKAAPAPAEARASRRPRRHLPRDPQHLRLHPRRLLRHDRHRPPWNASSVRRHRLPRRQRPRPLRRSRLLRRAARRPRKCKKPGPQPGWLRPACGQSTQNQTAPSTAPANEPPRRTGPIQPSPAGAGAPPTAAPPDQAFAPSTAPTNEPPRHTGPIQPSPAGEGPAGQRPQRCSSRSNRTFNGAHQPGRRESNAGPIQPSRRTMSCRTDPAFRRRRAACSCSAEPTRAFDGTRRRAATAYRTAAQQSAASQPRAGRRTDRAAAWGVRRWHVTRRQRSLHRFQAWHRRPQRWPRSAAGAAAQGRAGWRISAAHAAETRRRVAAPSLPSRAG